MHCLLPGSIKHSLLYRKLWELRPERESVLLTTLFYVNNKVKPYRCSESGCFSSVLLTIRLAMCILFLTKVAKNQSIEQYNVMMCVVLTMTFLAFLLEKRSKGSINNKSVIRKDRLVAYWLTNSGNGCSSSMVDKLKVRPSNDDSGWKKNEITNVTVCIHRE